MSSTTCSTLCFLCLVNYSGIITGKKNDLFYVQTCTETKRCKCSLTLNYLLVYIEFAWETSSRICLLFPCSLNFCLYFPWSLWYFLHLCSFLALYLYPKEACLLEVLRIFSWCHKKKGEIIFGMIWGRPETFGYLKIWEMYSSN